MVHAIETYKYLASIYHFDDVQVFITSKLHSEIDGWIASRLST